MRGAGTGCRVAEPSAGPDPCAPARRLRELLTAPELLVAPGVFDGLSARVAEQAGFAAVYLSGGAVARSSGVPDLGLLSMTEVLVRVREVVDAVGVPVLADADTGYGGVLNVRRTVLEMQRLGVAGLHLEDQVTPKKCGHYSAKALVSTDEMVGKLEAALDARTDPDLVLVARTDAVAVEGVDAALARARRYTEAGADAVFVEAPESREQMQRIVQEVQVPLVVNMFAGGRTPYLPAGELEEMGFAMALVPSDLQRAAVHAMQRAARALYDEGWTASMADDMVDFSTRDALVGLGDLQAVADRFEPGRGSPA